MNEDDKLEKVVKGLECCTTAIGCYECPYAVGGKATNACNLLIDRDALALLKAQEPVQPNGEQYQCNKCKFYQGVHNVMGHATCSFWNIGGVLWNDYCSRFYDFR